MLTFALIGAGAAIAGRHLDAIARVQGKLVAALDPNDSVGILDRYSLDTPFFTDPTAFARHLRASADHDGAAKTRRFLTVCSPNYLHEEHCTLGLRSGMDVICEKPIALEPEALDRLRGVESTTGRRVWCVLQLRNHPTLQALRHELLGAALSRVHDVSLTYVTPRGPWYDVSWKGDLQKSGGLATNIGIHMFDLLAWLFGPVRRYGVHLREARRMAGYVELERARVSWFLSVEPSDLPAMQREQRLPAFRAMRVDDVEIDFSGGAAELHHLVYAAILRGDGLGIAEAAPSVEIACALRSMAPEPSGELLHPLLRE